MSVSVIVTNPKNNKEKLINIPIAAEAFFQNYWLPLINQLELKWLKCFQSGLEISYDDKDNVIKELKRLKLYLLYQGLMNDNNTFMTERLDNLINKIEEIFDQRKDVTLYIG